jgi:integrase
LRKLIVTFNQVMKYAVRHRYINFNPVREAERPKSQGKDRPEQVKILNSAEIQTLLDAEKRQKYRTLYMLAIMSGARQGELLGLKWSEINWKNRQIRIRRTFNCGRWYQPKSKASIRKIDLGPKMMSELKKWKLACTKNDLDLVFPNRNGNPIDATRLVKDFFYPTLEAAKIKKVRFHDLRHTYASIQIKQGENIKYIQSQLGHATPTVTINVYGHLFESVNNEAAERFEGAVFGM